MENVAVIANKQGENWRTKVYAPSKSDLNEKEWKSVETKIKKRDGYTCRSCGLRVNLTVHHILPRDEGGTEIPDNLITLCRVCHDEIEECGFKTKLEIIDFKRKKSLIRGKIKEETPAIKWQQWVYGGFKRPQR